MHFIVAIIIIFFSVYFRFFQTINTIFTTNQCEKMTKCSSSLQCRDSNPRPSKNESSPITTRPGLPPLGPILFAFNFVKIDGCANLEIRRCQRNQKSQFNDALPP